MGETDDLRDRVLGALSGATSPAVRRRVSGGGRGFGIGIKGTSGMDAEDADTIDWRNRSSVVTDARGVRSAELVGLAQEPSFAHGRGGG